MSFATLWAHKDEALNTQRVVHGETEHFYLVHTVGKTPNASTSTQGIAKRKDFSHLSPVATVPSAVLLKPKAANRAPTVPKPKTPPEEKRIKKQKYAPSRS